MMTHDRSLKGRRMKFFWQKNSAPAQNSQQSGESIFTTATLKLQPENVFDPIAVMVIVEGLQVGYIAKSQSSDVTANIKRQHTTELEVPAHLGWDTENPQPYIGVKLMMGDLI